MAKTLNKQVYIWLNRQGIDNNLKSIRAAITKTANELNKLPIGTEEWVKVLDNAYFRGVKTEVRSVSVCCDKFEENHSNVERNGTN